MPTVNIPAFIGSGLNQFAPKRNDEIVLSWMLGEFAGCEWYKSNLLPLHISGDIGQAASPNNVITLVSVDSTGTILSFTEPQNLTDANAMKAGDLLQFNDGVSGQPNLRFLQFIGHQPSQQPVQVRVVANAATVSGAFTVTVYPPLISANNNPNQNINNALAAGMQATVLPSHRAGVLYSGDQFYLAMPSLPDQSPFTTVNMMDKDTGASIRHYYGVQFGQNVRSYVRDSIWGSDMVADNAMRFVFPM